MDMSHDRQALNQCFWDLGLRFQWDEATWAGLAGLPDLRAQLRQYLEQHQPHLLAVYDVDFLASLIEANIASPRGAMGMEAHRS
jgi:hypothetical protein